MLTIYNNSAQIGAKKIIYLYVCGMLNLKLKLKFLNTMLSKPQKPKENYGYLLSLPPPKPKTYDKTHDIYCKNLAYW